MIEWDEYVDITDETAVYPGARIAFGFRKEATLPVAYVTLGLSSEAGEIADVVKKYLRLMGEIDPHESSFKKNIMLEMGDLCWYLARLCRELDIDLENVLRMNVLKLKARKEKNELKVHD